MRSYRPRLFGIPDLDVGNGGMSPAQALAMAQAAAAAAAAAAAQQGGSLTTAQLNLPQTPSFVAAASPEEGMSTGMKVAIGVGAVAVVGGIAYFMMRR